MKHLAALYLIIANGNAALASDVYTVPADIRESFKRNNCVEIHDYYSESRVIEKPYIYGVKSLASKKANNDYTFIAWCSSRDRNADAAYILIANLGEYQWPGGCKFPIRGLDFPGGLSIVNKSISLSGFTAIGGKPIGSAKKTSGPVIRSDNDGLVYEFFCRRGAWLKRVID